MKWLLIVPALLVLLAIILPVSATYPNETNVTVPLKFSFQGGHNFGENPVEIFDQITGDILHIGDTGSQNITLPPDRDYTVRVEPAGMTDVFNSPDSGLKALMDWTDKNPLGVVIFAILFAIIGKSYRRK